MAKKAFAKKTERVVDELEVPDRDQQFTVGERSTKHPATYKISANVRDSVELKAAELTRALGRKVWPAHVAEAALAAFLELDHGKQMEMLER